jgi:hypothetical protein
MKTTATTARTETAEELAMTAEDAALARFNAALFPKSTNATNEAATHTPTPWRAGDCGRTVFGPKTAEPSPVTVATTDSTRTTTEEKRANVAMIVAAVNAHAGLVARVAELEAALDACLRRLDAHDTQSAPEALLARIALAKEGGK